MVEETITITLIHYQLLLDQINILQEEVKKLHEEVKLLKNGKNSKMGSTPLIHDFS